MREQARIVRTAAGARRYGVQIGQAYTEGRVPKRGEDGPRILLAKQQLTALGLLPEKADENSPHFGKYLQQGVRLFQQRHGLPVTGQLDVGTQRALNRRASAGKPGPRPGQQGGGQGKPASSRGGSGSGGGGRRPADAPAGDPADGTQRRHKVRVGRGENLLTIAERELGDRNRWPEIAKASGLPWANPRAMPVGTELVIPAGPRAPRGGAARGRGRGRGAGVPPLSQQAVASWMRTLQPAVRAQLVSRARAILAAARG